MSGTELIAAERERQKKVEGWTAQHDDEHDFGELVSAAICYAQAGSYSGMVTMHWPWDEATWKPSHDKVRNLVKAGALIAAEIDRRLRIATAPQSAQSEP